MAFVETDERVTILGNYQRISFKLPATVIAICSITVAIMGYLAIGAAHDILNKQSRVRLSSVASAQSRAIGASLDAMRTSVISQSTSPVFRSAMTALVGAVEAIPGDKAEHLRTRFVDENEHPYGQRQMTDYVSGRDAYNRTHRKVHPYFRTLTENNHYADFYLLDENGSILYSVMKKEDFASSIDDPTFKDQGLAKAVRHVLNDGINFEIFVFEDFSDYPLRDTPYSAFMAVPILASNGALIGIFAARIEASSLVQAGNGSIGLGETGEIFTVGGDSRVRQSSNMQMPSASLYSAEENADPVNNALHGETNVLSGLNQTGESSIAAYEPLEFEGVIWAIVARQAADELFSDARILKGSILNRSIGLIFVASIIAFLVSKSLTKPIHRVRQAMTNVAGGDLESRIADSSRADEIGDIAKSLETLRHSLVDARTIEDQARMLGGALEATSANLMIVDTELSVLHANDATGNVLDKLLPDRSQNGSEPSLLGTNITNLLGKHADLAKQVSNGKTEAMSVDLALGDAHFSVTMRALFKNNSAYGAVVEWVDQSDEFRRTALLQSIEQRQCLMEFSTTGVIIDANDKICKLLGGSRNDFVGAVLEDLIILDKSKVAHPEGFIAELLREGAAWGQFNINGKHGKQVWVDGGMTVVSNDQNEPLSIVLIGNDISLARQNMDAAKGAQQRTLQQQKAVVTILGASLSRLAEGDLVHRIETEFSGEYDQLRQDFNRAVSSLQTTMLDLVKSSGTIDASATEIAMSGKDLSTKTKAQSSTLASTASEISTLSLAVSEASDRTQAIKTMVTNASNGASSSSAVMDKAILAMQEIETSSKAISNITKLIEEIAFQTNLLALNAGVEAARAGEAGQGFAVVANEVRALAQRSSEAVDDINSVIAATTTQISNGSNLVSQSGQSLNKMVDTVIEISAQIDEIAISSSKQSKNLFQIDAAVKELDEVTKINAKLLADTNTVGRQLKQEASSLSDACSTFIVDGNCLETDIVHSHISPSHVQPAREG